MATMGKSKPEKDPRDDDPPPADLVKRTQELLDLERRANE
jgi:hypothetical protein